jgi:hypothetical protein
MTRLLVLALGALAFVACGGGTEATTGLPEGPPSLDPAEKGNLTLYVSNQSFDRDPVDIRVLIDRKPAVEDDFAVGNQHNWVEFRFDLPDGEHVIHVESLDGEATLERPFGVEGKRWAVVDYWCCGGQGEPKFTFRVSARPMLFD